MRSSTNESKLFQFCTTPRTFCPFCMSWMALRSTRGSDFQCKKKSKKEFGGSHLRHVMSGVCWLRMFPLNSCSHSSHGSSRKMCSSLGGVISAMRDPGQHHISNHQNTRENADGKTKTNLSLSHDASVTSNRQYKSPILEYPEFALCSDHLFHIQLNRRLQAEDVFININGVRFWRPYPGGQNLMPLQSSCIYGG